jgi:aminopeptidase YwaD
VLQAMSIVLVLAGAGERRIPFWPDAVPDAIRAEVDGVAALETVRELGRFHRVHGSPGFAAAAEHVRKKLRDAGLADAAIEHFPADGQTRYGHFRSYLGWTPQDALLEEVSPHRATIARFPDLPVALADYSQDADATVELVDVGDGTTPASYDGRDVAGKIVVASGPLPAVHRLACEERGALGFLSDFPNQTTAWSGDDRDLVRWGHLSPYQTANRFAFMLSKRQAGELRDRLAKGEKIVVHARVRAKMTPGSYDVVSATIPGADPNAGDVLLTAHLCHESAGANDNASGSAAILEVARALQAAIARGSLPKPRRTLRFLWLPEIAGSQAWLVAHEDLAKRTMAGIHMDMVGGLLSTTHGTFHLSRSAETLPHVVNDVARVWLDDVVDASAQYAEHGGDPRHGLVWLPGSRESFLADLRAVEMGSDHEVFEESTFGVPMVYFHDWPDVTIHTNKDQPENLDATKLGRVAYLGAGIAWTLAALPDEEAPKLVAVARAGCAERLARARLRADVASDAYDGALAVRETAAETLAELRSIATWWPAAVVTEKRAEASLDFVFNLPAPPPDRDARVPVRSAGVRGPLSVYYYDHLAEVLGPSEAIAPFPSSGDPERLAWETLNLVDGDRTAAEIRDVLTGRYAPVAEREVSAYLDLLARAKVIMWR